MSQVEALGPSRFSTIEEELTIRSEGLLDHVRDLLHVVNVLQDHLLESRKVLVTLGLITDVLPSEGC